MGRLSEYSEEDQARLKAETSTSADAQHPICAYCEKQPAQLLEYIDAASEENMLVDDYVRQEEGTYNHEHDTFCCTSCYIKIGMPSSPRGWKAPARRL